MLEIVEGDLFRSGCQTLVNPVNCMGVMGKGIAVDFKTRYPEMFRRYQAICARGALQPGLLWLYTRERTWVLCFPTKQDWRKPSQVQWLQAGLLKLSETWEQRGITSLAIPAIGCGLGGLDFDMDLLPLAEQYFGDNHLLVKLYRK
jgi:O-acetyl-ADP-ribose deacetylase (regulator of RNase III)